MIKDGKKVESKSMVCTECVTLMTPTDYTEHNGVCQLCRGATDGNKLFVIYYTYEGDDEPCIDLQVSTGSEDSVEEAFRDGTDSSFDYLFVHEVTRVYGHGTYDVILRPRD